MKINTILLEKSEKDNENTKGLYHIESENFSTTNEYIKILHKNATCIIIELDERIYCISSSKMLHHTNLLDFLISKCKNNEEIKEEGCNNIYPIIIDLKDIILKENEIRCIIKSGNIYGAYETLSEMIEPYKRCDLVIKIQDNVDYNLLNHISSEIYNFNLYMNGYFKALREDLKTLDIQTDFDYDNGFSSKIGYLDQSKDKDQVVNLFNPKLHNFVVGDNLDEVLNKSTVTLKLLQYKINEIIDNIEK